MALPPIISGSPLFKMFKTDKVKVADKVEAGPQSTPGVKTPKDVVEISEAARRKIEGLKNLSDDNLEKVRSEVAQARSTLEASNLALGLKSDFA